MLKPLLEFFGDKENFDVLVRYRKRKGAASVSLLDWFTVNYAKKNGVRYGVIRDGREKTVLVEQSYAAALCAHTKEYFDPFARGSKKGKGIVLVGEDGEEITTTVRQLNFFRWAITNGVIDYVDKHAMTIHEDMCARSNRGGKKSADKRKKQLSTSSSRSLGVHSVKVAVFVTRR